MKGRPSKSARRSRLGASMTAVVFALGSAGRESTTFPLAETMNVGPSFATRSHDP